MDFFNKLSTLGIRSMTLKVLFTENDNATVVIAPHLIANDSALKALKPLHLTGNVNLLDEQFFDSISEPLSKTAKLDTNVMAYEVQQEEVAKQTKIQKDKQDKIKKAKDALKKLVEGENYDSQKDKNKTIKAIENLQTIDPSNSYAVKIKKELTEQLTNSTNLFTS